MKLRMAVGVCVVLLAVAMAWVRAEEKAAADAKPAAEKQAPAGKLVQPWSKLSGLSDEQKTKIKEIHAAANAEVKKIREKEETDIVALLNDEQKAELKTVRDQMSAAQKEKSAAAKKPADGEKKSDAPATP